jgi:di/tricarboxylate transporter
MSTPPMTMTLAGGYRFKDYIKMGGLYNVLAYILIILLFPLVLNL